MILLTKIRTNKTRQSKRRQQSQGICCHPVTESCDDDQELNLIGNVEVREVSTSDTDFLQDGTCRAQEVFTEKIERIHADGAYHSPENQEFCSKNNIDLHLHAIQGAKGRYQLERT